MSLIPQRIVCLSAEAADWLGRIGAWKNVVGVTVYFDQPANLEPKPRVSGFSTANLTEIEKLNPDLIITFSDVQMKLAVKLRRRGFRVLAMDQRTLAETKTALTMLAQIVGHEVEAEKWIAEFSLRLAPVQIGGRRPRVYFEEWNDPLIAGIGWVSELIERAGGEDVFARLRTKRAAAKRVVMPEQVLDAAPEIILASWCGKPVNIAEIASRPGWGKIPAVRERCIYEISDEDILQPGFRLVHGFEQMKRIILSADEVACAGSEFRL